MRPWLRKLTKTALAVCGAAVLLAFAGTIGFRLLLSQLPSYENDLRAWVNRELGVQLSFAQLDAGWGWRGPEITFHDASLAAAPDSGRFLAAREARVGFSPFQLVEALVARRPPGVDRLTLEGTELTLVKEGDGVFRLQGAPTAAARTQDLKLEVPPDIEVFVRDSRVLYLDPSRGVAWNFEDVEGSMRRASGALRLEAQARPPREVAARVSLTVQGFLSDRPVDGAAPPAHGVTFTGDWRVAAEFEQVDLSIASRVLPASAVAPQAGQGDVSVWLEWQRGALASGNVQLALRDVAVPTALGTPGSIFDSIALKGDWHRDAGTWRVALRDVTVARAGRAWPADSDTEIEIARDADGELERLALHSDFMRLEDLTPFLSPLPDSRALQSWLTLAPRGDIRGAALELERSQGRVDYTISAKFDGLGFQPLDDLPGVGALTGEVRADTRSGRVELHTGASALDWPALFRKPLEIDSIAGLVVWREGQDAVRVVSDDLVVATPDASTRTSLELTLPRDGSSPLLDLATSVSTAAIANVQKYLPAHKMPPGVVDWLDNALQGGLVRSANVTFVGPLRAFPFDGGEGEFRAVAQIEDGRLAYVQDWPLAEDLVGTIEFVNASFAAHGSGRALGNRAADVQVTIPNLRAAVLAMKLGTIGPLDQVLDYLHGAPLIARTLGPDFARLEAPSGTGEVAVDLSLPLRDKDAYKLTASLNIVDGELAFRGFDPHATEIRGSLALHGSELSGEGIKAIFLDGPITARVDVPHVDGYRARLSLDGEVTIDAVADAFDLPFPKQLAGQTTWQGQLLIPAPDTKNPPPPKIIVDSNLSGVAMHVPAPFAKAPGEPTNLEVEIAFAADGGLDLTGYLGASRRFALEFTQGPTGKFEFQRAALRFGGAQPELRFDKGITLDGKLAALDVDEWLAMREPSGSSQFTSEFAGAELEVADLEAFGQELGATTLSARRRTDDWQVEVDSSPVSGTVLVPADLAKDPQIVAVMRRLYLSVGGEGSVAKVDPRQLPGLQLHADEFALGQRQLGRLDAEIVSDPLGLRLVSFESSSDSFGAQGSGGWFTGADGDTTRFAVSLTSSNVAKTLEQLGFAPVIAAETLDVTASLYWPGPPSGDWMAHVGGDFALHATKGSLLDVQPGAGRVVGLLSLNTLPRRLALDFRDVFNKGLVFDAINGDFVVQDGNAYTDNLKLTGPVAEIGLIGRTGLRDHDYRQQAVVTAEPSNMLPTVGLLGGPAVAAALLLFTKIFKEPLKGIGRASYCLSGSWQEPMVERLTAEQLEKGEICAELPPNGMPKSAPEIAAR